VSPPGEDTCATDEAHPLDGESSPGEDTNATGEGPPLDGEPLSPDERVMPSPSSLLIEQEVDYAVREP